MSSIKIRIKQLENDITQVRALIAHPMQTGYKKDEQGNKIPAHFIKELTVEHNDIVISTTIMGSGISRNPYFAFKFKGGKSGDTITISWVDNLGYTASEQKSIK
jgi:sulfur-oxidizing protein SoxZ